MTVVIARNYDSLFLHFSIDLYVPSLPFSPFAGGEDAP
jgi:hypothetical protein